MHLLATEQGELLDGATAVDLDQPPGDLVVLSAADNELALLAAALDRLPETGPSARLANLSVLSHPYSVDLYVEKTLSAARLVVVRLLGGLSYWRYGVEQIAAAARARGALVAFLPGEDLPDPQLEGYSTLPPAALRRLHGFLTAGGIDNAVGFWRGCAELATGDAQAWGTPGDPTQIPRAGIYPLPAPQPSQPGIQGPPGPWSGEGLGGARRASPNNALWVPILFYRAHLLAGATEPVETLAAALAAQGLAPLPIYVASPKAPDCVAALTEITAAHPPAVVISTCGFAAGSPDGEGLTAPSADTPDVPVLQAVMAGLDEARWTASARGLGARDLAMNVALPEVDGRLLAGVLAFKAAVEPHPRSASQTIRHRAAPDRAARIAALAAAWARLRATPWADKRVAITLVNYPLRDGRLANGVGLDAPAGAVTAIQAMRAAGLVAPGAPEDPEALIRALQAGPTNDRRRLSAKAPAATLSLADYARGFARLPESLRAAMLARWGAPEQDPFVRDGAFLLAAQVWGGLALGLQPSRGYDLDEEASLHDAALPPPHRYLAYYLWLTSPVAEGGFGAQAVIHFGKHGSLEWLPGKAAGLSENCFPDAVLPPLPHLYPFIVNDPGEGAQAKRRTAAVILDHLTPPPTRAGSWGPQAELEALLDEWADAARFDPRRLPGLTDRIAAVAGAAGLDRDCGFSVEDRDSWARLDAHLCALKELQIRDGLHIYGQAPAPAQTDALVAAMLRLPRRRGQGADASLHRALAADLGWPEGLDPLDLDPAAPWNTAVCPVLGAHRIAGQAVAALEELALDLIAGRRAPDPAWTRVASILTVSAPGFRARIDACAGAEIAALLAGLEGRFVAPGPSGAPTRGRPEVLPTGRNFFSVDCRAVPTAAAWTLGWRSAHAVIERHLQEHGDWPRHVALTCWGTAAMRTGGDDLAQAMALIGARPTWNTATGRVEGFEILPLSVMDRPRVDVTLRVSGLFRDAFPFQISLFDEAAAAIAALDEPVDANPLRGQLGPRVFSAAPGSYGAGLRELLDRGGWRDRADLAAAFRAAGAFSYGAGNDGADAAADFDARLATVDAVLHNQDNREHDLLDSDDYQQFEGGLFAAVESLSGAAPAVYHNDHSRPEAPKIRSLAEEIALIIRGRCANPRWIEGCMRHGYRGAAEIAATVDHAFGFAALSGAVADRHFDALYDAYLNDETVLAFLERANPDALRDIAARLLEAIRRGLWRPRANAAPDHLAALLAEAA